MRIQSQKVMILSRKGECPKIEEKYKSLRASFICLELGTGRRVKCPFFEGLTREGVVKCSARSKVPKNP